jgi:hypothetical protein
MGDRSKYCANLIFESASGLFDEAKAKDLIRELEDRSAEKAGVTASKIDQATLDLLGEHEGRQLQAKHEAYNNILKERNIKDNYIDKFKNKARGLFALLDGVQENIKNSRFSIGAVQQQVRKKYMGRLINLLNKDEVFSHFEDPANDLALAKELRGEATGNANVAKAAEHVKQVYEELRKEAASHGLYVPELKDFGAKQTHDVGKILKGDLSLLDRIKLLKNHDLEYRRQYIKTRWINTIKPRLDLVRTFGNASDKRVDELLGEIHDAFVSGEHYKPPPATDIEQAFSFKPKGSLAKRVAAHRVLHFKDATSWHEYNKIYGHSNTVGAVVQTIKGLSDQTGLASIMGTEPETMYDNIVSYVKKANPYVSKMKLNLAKATFDKLTGYSNIPDSRVLASNAQAMRAWTSMAHLGRVLPTSYNDMAIRASLLQDNHGLSFLESWGSGLKEMLPRFKDKEQQMILDSIGVWSDSQFGHVIRYFSAEDSPAGTLPDMMQLFFKLNGMTWWDRVHKEGVATVLSRTMALRRNTAFESLPTSEQRTMKLYGLEDKEWNLIRNKDHVLNLYGNKKFIAPDAVQHFTDNNIKEYLGKANATPREIQSVRDDIETRLRTYFLDQVDHAIITPGASDRAFAELGTQPGTVTGEIMRTAGQFKYFSVGLTRRVGARQFLGTKAEGASVFTNYKALPSYINFAVTATGMGYLAGITKDLLAGKTPMPANNPETWIRAIDTGATGIFSQVLFNSYQKFGNSFSSELHGPVAGTIDDLVSLMYKIGTWQHPGAAAVNFAQRNIPFGNLWMMDTALKALFLDDMKNRLTPGYKLRVNKALRKNGQKLWYR